MVLEAKVMEASSLSTAFEILPADAFPENERVEAKVYWSAIDTTLYRGIRPWSETIAKRVLSYQPRSVFEFGCNSGGNLEAVRSEDPGIELFGLDINGAGTAHARAQGLNCGLGDETTLLALPDRCFDLSFTLSVIDHLPEPRGPLRSLFLITRRVLILHEPWLGKEGRVVRNTSHKTGAMVDTTPYSYSWNYEAVLAEIAPDWQLTVEPGPLPTNIGRYYNFYTLTRRATHG